MRTRRLQLLQPLLLRPLLVALLVTGLALTGCEPSNNAGSNDAGSDDAGSDDGGVHDAGSDDAGFHDGDAGATETCDDGVQNQGEDGVDCGGPCSTVCPSAYCTDGVENEGETGIDCGGPCTVPCEFLIRDEIHTFIDDDCGWYFWYDTSRLPPNWYAPANYWNGSLYTRYEILSQPTTEDAGFQFVMWKVLGDELAGAPMTVQGGAGNVGEFSEVLNTYWVEGAGIDLTDSANVWRLGIAVHEPGEGWVACPSWGFPQERWDRRGLWYPMELRFTIVAVAEGAEFSGWSNWVSTPPTDGVSEGPNPNGN
jgi:hypothetical protein